jgi:hypothetical protein
MIPVETVPGIGGEWIRRMVEEVKYVMYDVFDTLYEPV